jgi:hypothetical protein
MHIEMWKFTQILHHQIAAKTVVKLFDSVTYYISVIDILLQEFKLA